MQQSIDLATRSNAAGRERVRLTGPVCHLPSGDRLHFIQNDCILEMPNGDKLFLCNGFAQIDSETEVEIKNQDGESVFIYPDGDVVAVRAQRISYIRRGGFTIIADPDDARNMWILGQ